jgi:hypothetical protein
LGNRVNARQAWIWRAAKYISPGGERLPANPEKTGMGEDLILFQAVVLLWITL